MRFPDRIAGHDGTGAVLREYIWLDGRPLAIVEGGQTYQLHWDHILRPVMATSSTGAVVWAARYLPFGGIDLVLADTGALTQNIRFPGQWFQAETGLHQNGMRDYDPTTGRYLQADPLGLVDGASVYGYARQSPVRWTDPTGRQSLGCYMFPGLCEEPGQSPWPKTPEVGDWPPEPEAVPPQGGYCPLPGLPGGITDGNGGIALPDIPAASGQTCENCSASVSDAEKDECVKQYERDEAECGRRYADCIAKTGEKAYCATKYRMCLERAVQKRQKCMGY
jgi:RHS repeat-associated protein